MRRKEGESLLLFCVPFFDIASAEERQGGKERGHAHTHRVSDGEHDGVEESKTSLVLGCEVLEGDVQGTSLLVIAVAHFFFWLSTPFSFLLFFPGPLRPLHTRARSEELKTFPPLKPPPKSLPSFSPLHATRHAPRGSSPSTHDSVSPLFAPTPTREVVRALANFTILLVESQQRVPKLEKKALRLAWEK